LQSFDSFRQKNQPQEADLRIESNLSQPWSNDQGQAISEWLARTRLALSLPSAELTSVPAIVQQLCPSDKQHFMIGNLEDAVAFGDWLHTAWLQALVLGLQ
jgi:hypothetical protein